MGTVPHEGAPVKTGLTATSSESLCVLEGLENGTASTFTVVATNDVGDSEASAASNPVTPASTPSAPELGTVVSAAGALVLGFQPPEDDVGDLRRPPSWLGDAEKWRSVRAVAPVHA